MPRSWVKLILFGFAALTCLGSPLAAKTTGVNEDQSLQSGPCYLALVDKNAEHPTTAPNRELGDACRVENGDIDKAWARVIRLWGSDSADLPDYDAYVPADAPLPGNTPLWLTIAASVLLYGTLATPLRPVARLLTSRSASGRFAVEGLVALGLRATIALVFFEAFSLSGVALVGCLGLLAALVWAVLRRTRVGPVGGVEAPAASALSEFIAAVVNDLAGGLAGLIGLALMANHQPLVLVGALLAGLILSVPQVIVLRRAIRLTPLAETIVTALLVAAVAFDALNEPLMASLIGRQIYAMSLVPAVLALGVIALGWRLNGMKLFLLAARSATG